MWINSPPRPTWPARQLCNLGRARPRKSARGPALRTAEPRHRCQGGARGGTRGSPALWRRRESNPRPRTHREEPLQACPALSLHPPAGCRPPTDGLAILWSPAPGDWLSLGGEPVRWRRIPSHGPKTERRRYLTRLGSECEIVLRTCFVPGCFTRPTGDLGLQLLRRTDHVETRSPPETSIIAAALSGPGRSAGARRAPRCRAACRAPPFRGRPRARPSPGRS